MVVSDRIPTHDMLTQTAERQTSSPALEQDSNVERPSHPAHQLQRIAGNRFVQQRLARQAAGPSPPQAGPVTLHILEHPGGGRPLPSPVRDSMELALGADFSDVRVHVDDDAGKAAAELNARAFTVGKDIYFGRGQYRPRTPAGRDLIAHELGHALERPDSAKVDLTAVYAPPADPMARQSLEVERVVAEEVSLEGVPEAEAEPEAMSPEEPQGAAKLTSESETEQIEQQPTEEGPAAEGPEVARAVQEETVSEGASSEGTARPDIELMMAPPPAGLSPPSQARIASSQRAATEAATRVRELPSASASTAAARGAVAEPEAETTARAESHLVDALGARPEPSPEIVELCAAIRESIREKRPVDEDELVEAEPEEMAAEAGSELDEAVEGDTERVQSSYHELNEPQTGTPEQMPEAIEAPPEEVSVPEIGAEAAAPDGVNPDDVSLDADLAEADADIERAGMNTEPAQLIEDGPVAQARAARGELSETAETGPSEVLMAQDAALQEASADMVALQEQALASLTSARAGTVSGVGTQQNEMVSSEEQIREQLSARAHEIFTTAQSQVNDLLTPLPEIAMEKWEKGVARYSSTFRQSLDRVQQWIDERHSGVGGAILAGWDALTGLPDWVTEAYDRAEQQFGDNVCDLITEISAEVNSVIAAAEEIIDQARQAIDDLFSQELPESLQAWADAERQRIHGQLDGLQEQVTTTRDDFNRNLSRRAVQAVREVQDEVQQLREAAKGLIGRIADAINAFLEDPVRAIINGLLRLVGISPASFWALAAKVEQVVSDIADDPKGFVNNLVSAVARGFQQFFDNIGQHLLEGLLDWLFDGLTSVGVDIPTDLSLKSVITFFLQLMGITWSNIRRLLVRHIGEENVALIEQAWELMSSLIEQGPEGIFEMIKEHLDPRQLLDQVMDAAIDYVVEALIKNVTVRVIALFNPVGAIVQAVELIYRVLKWIFENAARLFSFVETVVNGLADIISGNIGGMAKAIEAALAKLIPPVIDFLAGLIGLGDLPDKVVETVQKLQDWVSSILDRVIGWLAEQGRRLLQAVGLGGGEAEEDAAIAEGEGWWNLIAPFDHVGESHELLFEGEDAQSELVVRSTRMPLQAWLDQAQAELAERRDEMSDVEYGQNETLLGLIASRAAEIRREKERFAALYETEQRRGVEVRATSIGVQSGQAIHRLFLSILELMKGLTFRGESDARPPSRLLVQETHTVASTGDQIGKIMVAQPLSINPGGLSGSRPGGDRSTLFTRIKTARPGTYVQAHLLNDNLHGAGQTENLAPLPGPDNTLMSSRMEEPVKGAVLGEHKVVSYRMQFRYGGHSGGNLTPLEQELPTSIEGQAYGMKLKEDVSATDEAAENPTNWAVDRSDEILPSSSLSVRMPTASAEVPSLRRLSLSDDFQSAVTSAGMPIPALDAEEAAVTALALVPGIGTTLAQRVLDARPTSPADLENVRGIGAERSYAILDPNKDIGIEIVLTGPSEWQ